jgi:hypothetical protein
MATIITCRRLVAKSLVNQGTEGLILVGRQAPSPETQTLIQDWQSQGIQIIVFQLDISDEEAVKDLFQQDLVKFLKECYNVCKHNQQHLAEIQVKVRKKFPNRFFKSIKQFY